MTKTIFKDFPDYWYYARHFSERQRYVFLESLPSIQQIKLKESYIKGGWADVLLRNDIHDIIDSLNKKYGYNILDIKCKVLSSKSVYLPIIFWESLNTALKDYSPRHIMFVMGGIKGISCKENKDVVLLISDQD